MQKASMNKLDEQLAHLEVTSDLIEIVMDFIENECPKNTQGNSGDILASMTCYANRSGMFYHALYAAFEKIKQISENIEKIIDEERKTQ